MNVFVDLFWPAKKDDICSKVQATNQSASRWPLLGYALTFAALGFIHWPNKWGLHPTQYQIMHLTVFQEENKPKTGLEQKLAFKCYIIQLSPAKCLSHFREFYREVVKLLINLWYFPFFGIYLVLGLKSVLIKMVQTFNSSIVFESVIVYYHIYTFLIPSAWISNCASTHRWWQSEARLKCSHNTSSHWPNVPAIWCLWKKLPYVSDREQRPSTG